MADRPKLLPITEEMKEWSADLDHELTSWPRTRRKPMFGLIAFYRDSVIFAAIPRTKSFEPENSIGFKLYKLSVKTRNALQKDLRIHAENPQLTGWIGFQIRESRDLNAALEWLALAYDGAAQIPALRP
jgi:hypothetical protein